MVHFQGAGHRRGLVVEVAPGVVDVIAVALSSALNVITYVVKSDVSADEADLQGPTWVDSDDEPMDNEPLVTIAEGTTVPIVDSELDLSARVRGRFESPPASAVQGSGVFGGLTKRDRPESQVSAPSRIRMVQNRFEVLGEEDDQDFEMSPTEVTTTERLFPGEQGPPTLPVCSGAVRREDSTLPIRRLRLVGGSNISQSTTVVQVADQGMGVCLMILLWRTQCLMSSLHIPMRRAVQKHTPKPLMAWATKSPMAEKPQLRSMSPQISLISGWCRSAYCRGV